MNKQSFKDKCIKDENGDVVIGQSPNLPLKVAVVGFLAGIFITTGKPGAIVDAITFGAFFTWAWLEVFEGVNYLRRLYGLLVLVALVASKVF